MFQTRRSSKPRAPRASRPQRMTDSGGIWSKRRPQQANDQPAEKSTRAAERQREGRGHENSATGNQTSKERKGCVSSPEPDARSFCVGRARLGRPENDQCNASKNSGGVDRFGRCGKRQPVSSRRERGGDREHIDASAGVLG